MFDWHAYGLIFALIAIDYALGVVGAMINRNFSSSIMRVGLAHKLTYVVAIVIANLIVQLAAHIELGFVATDAIVTLVCAWIAIAEVGSILENLVKINPALGDNSFMGIFSNRKDGER